MLNILMATSEAAPLAKVGGLADFCGVLPRELAKLGHHPSVIMPAFRHVHQSGQPIEPTDVHFEIPIGNKTVPGRLWETRLPGSEVPVYLVEQDDFFDRPEIYGDHGRDYRDNCQRFVFFCRAVMEAIRLLDLDVDLIHVNDWPTALIPVYLELEYRGVRRFENIVSLLTIHNIAYQGQFWHWDMLLTGLDWKYFNWHQMEFFGDLNLLKSGIVFADAMNTVSTHYAHEIQSVPMGCGLEGVLQQHATALSGIVNGIDNRQWDPRTDRHIPARYGTENWRTGKAVCKSSMQKNLQLACDKDAPLIALISPLTDEKGIDLIAQIAEAWLSTNPAQWVILGSGDPKYHHLFRQLSRSYPQKMAVRREGDDPRTRVLIAGADIMLVPSRIEPCGVHQLYGLRYGTVPVVHAVGSLADTITHHSGPEPRNAATANGFCFTEYTASALDAALRQACKTFDEYPDVWSRIVAQGMQQDWSWAVTAANYARLYGEIVARTKHMICA